MKRNVWFMVMLSVVSVPMLFGQMGPGMGRGGRAGWYAPGEGIRGISRITNLTQDQQDKIFAIQQKLRADTAAMESEVAQIRYDLHKVLTAATLDEKKAKDLYAKLQAARQKLAERRFAAEMEILKLLTSEQRQQLQTTPLYGAGGRMGRKW